MYTRCPHRTTIFRVTTEQLRESHGDIPCVTCAQSFNVLDSLSDSITTLIATPNTSAEDDETVLADDSAAANDDEDTELQPILDLSDSEPEHDTTDDHGDDQFDDPADDDGEPEAPFFADEPEPAGNEQSPDSMEFDAPERIWTKFFVSNDASEMPDDGHYEPTLEADSDRTTPETEPSDDEPAGQPWDHSHATGSFELQTADQDEWKRFLAEVNDDKSTTPKDEAEEETENNVTFTDPDSSDDAEPAFAEPLSDEFSNNDSPGEVETAIIPPWLTDETANDAPPGQRRGLLPSWPTLGVCAVLTLLLAGQLLHYKRDALAAHATHGAVIRQVYALLGAPLYPDWPLDAFEVTGTKAVTGRSSRNTLDILANVIVHGQYPVGLPLIRVVLRDRWENSVATRVFNPDEYLRDFDAAQLLVTPGTALPVEISVADPGAEALGYIVDVCLPRRKTGLECQIAKDPFQ